MITQTVIITLKAEFLQGVHDFNTDVLKLALYAATADLGASTAVYTAVGEISGAGYTAGGETMTGVSVNPQGFVSFSNVVWPAASFTARGALIYNSSKANRAIAVLDFGADKTATTSFTVQTPPNTATSALLRFF